MKYPNYAIINNAAATSAYYHGQSAASSQNATTAVTEAPVPQDLTLEDFYAEVETAPGVGTSRAIALRDNAADTALAVTIADTDTFESITGTNAMTAGDRLNIGNIVTGSPAATRFKSAYYITSEDQVLMTTSTAGIAANTTRYLPVQGSSSNTFTASTQVSQKSPINMTLKNFYARRHAGITTGAYTSTLYVNGVASAVVLTLDSANQQVSDTSTTVSVSEDDELYWEVVATGVSAARVVMLSCTQTPQNPGDCIYMNGDGTATTTGTRYFLLTGTLAGNGTEAVASSYALPMTVTKVKSWLSAAPGGGNTKVLWLRKNGVDQTGGTFGAADTVLTDTTPVTVALGDKINYRQAASGTPTSSYIKTSLVINVGAFTPKIIFI